MGRRAGGRAATDLLVSPDLTESDGSGSVSVRLLDSSGGGRRLSGSLGGKLLSGSLDE